MAELGIITMLAKKPKKQSFTMEQLIEIYEESGRSTDINVLKAKASELYPDVIEDGKPPIFISAGVGRGYVIDGNMVKPEYTISTYRATSISIMADGTPMKF